MASPSELQWGILWACADDLQTDLAKAEPADTIDDGDESFQPCDFVGANQDQRLAGMGNEGGVELLVGDRMIVHEQFTPRRDGNDERGFLPVAGRRGLSQIDRNLARCNECGGGQHDNKLTSFSSAQIFAFPWEWFLLGWHSFGRRRFEDTHGGGAGGKGGGKSPPIIARSGI